MILDENIKSYDWVSCAGRDQFMNVDGCQNAVVNSVL